MWSQTSLRCTNLGLEGTTNATKDRSHCSWSPGMHSDSPEYKIRVPLGCLTCQAKLSTSTTFSPLGPTVGTLSSATKWTPINNWLSHMFCSHVFTNRNIHILSTEIMMTKTTSQHLCKINMDSNSIKHTTRWWKEKQMIIKGKKKRELVQI